MTFSNSSVPHIFSTDKITFRRNRIRRYNTTRDESDVDCNVLYTTEMESPVGLVRRSSVQGDGALMKSVLIRVQLTHHVNYPLVLLVLKTS